MNRAPNKKPFCTEDDGTQHFWGGKPKVSSQDHVKNLRLAWNILNGSITCKEGYGLRPTVFLFDGHTPDRTADVIPFLSHLAPEHAHIHALNRDIMENTICMVKDCFVNPLLTG